MAQSIDKLAILNLAAGSELIGAVKMMEENLEVRTIKIIRSDPTAALRLVYTDKRPEKTINCSETPIIDCEITASAILEHATTALIEYSLGGILE